MYFIYFSYLFCKNVVLVISTSEKPFVLFEGLTLDPLLVTATAPSPFRIKPGSPIAANTRTARSQPTPGQPDRSQHQDSPIA
jgi:hypothetical protein